MFRGFYTAATGMIAQQRRTEMLSNNISNASTPGFKADQSTVRSFPDMLLSSIQRKGEPSLQNGFDPSSMKRIGALGTGVYMQETLPNYMQGALMETSRPTDIALADGNMPTNATTGKKGTIFFKVQSDGNRQAYTRNGNFTLDGQGYLTMPTGKYVLDDQNRRIQFQNDNFVISKEGNIIVDGQQRGRLGVVFSDRPDALSKRENGLYFTPDGNNLPSAYANNNVTFTTEQGFTEGSNVDAAKSMTDMMTAYRVFEANQKLLQAYDRSMEKAVNEIGRV